MMAHKARLISTFAIVVSQFCLFVLRSSCEDVDRPCYFPDGSLASEDKACSSSQTQSFCCGSGWTCLDNHICQWTQEYTDDSHYGFARGSCTDIEWKSDQCPQFCKGSPGAYNNSISPYSSHNKAYQIRCLVVWWAHHEAVYRPKHFQLQLSLR